MILQHDLYIEPLNRKRRVRVYLPYNYDQTDERYPVFYMQDGQNLMCDEEAYGGASWGVTDQYNSIGQPQVIVVGIDHGVEFRFNEYSPFPGDELARKLYRENTDEHGMGLQVPACYGGEGKEYLEWLSFKLKPFIDRQYRTLADQKHTSIIGSSMGGLISLYAGLYYPQIYGNLGVLSPAFWFGKLNLMKELDTYSMQRNQRVFLSVGTNETGIADKNIYLEDAIEIERILVQKGYNCTFHIVENAIHYEKDWEKLLPDIALYFSHH